MSPGASGQAGPWDVTSAKARLEMMCGKVQPEPGLQDVTEGQQQGCRVCGSKALGYGEGWDLKSTGSLASCQTGLNAARTQDIDPFISCIPLAAPWKLRPAQEMGGRQHPCCPSRGAAHDSRVPCCRQGPGALPHLRQRCKLAQGARGGGSRWIWLGGGIEMIVADICLSAAAILISGAQPALICLLILM